MAPPRRPRGQIAADLGVSARTVQLWLNAYCERGLDGLAPRKVPGAAPRIPERRAGEVRQWVIEGPAACGLDRANRTYEELAGQQRRTRGLRVRRSAVQAFCARHGIRPYRPSYRFLRGDPDKQREAGAELAALKKAARGELVLLGQDEARFPMVPTVCATLGVKGHRPVVGTRDCKDLLSRVRQRDCVDGRLHTRTLECPAAESRRAREHKPGRAGLSKTRRLQEAFAKHLREVGKAYPAGRHRRVVLVIDNAPWHRGGPVAAALADCPHLELYRLPSYSPWLAVIERLWKVLLRRRAPHNRRFDTLKDLKASLRNSLRYFQTVRSRIISLIGGRFANATTSSGV